jgi:hypothetical protein
LYLLGVAGIAAGITLLFLGMRAVMDVGGFCAEGGAYEIRQHCPEGATSATLLGIFGGLASFFLAAWKGAAVGEGALSALFLAWPALFGALGFNFLQYGLDPPGDDPGLAWGWLLCGVLFEAMAFGPLLLGAWAARATVTAPRTRMRQAAPGGERLHATIVAARERRAPGGSDLPPLAPPGAAGDQAAATHEREGAGLVDALERLAALRRAGSLTDDEYARAKAELLDRADA